MRAHWFFAAFSLLFLLGPSHALALTDEEIKALLAKAGVNARAENIAIRQGQGRIDLDPANKKSLYVFTPNPQDPASPTFLIPLSTVRFSSNRYHTPAWWEANGAALAESRAQRSTAPREDGEAVRRYLQQHNLSTNPDVVVLKKDGLIETTPLKQFLLEEYKRQGSEVTLFRGSNRGTELAEWRAGRSGYGSEYYTPSATYAWRYARKTPGPPFLEALESNQAPLFEFKVPMAVFEQMVNDGEVTLGVELPKSAHDAFQSGGQFRDVLYGNSLYLGDPRFGLEFEILATKTARNKLVPYFLGPISAERLGEEADKQIDGAMDRLRLQFPTSPEATQGRNVLSIPSDLQRCLRRFQELRAATPPS